MRIIGLTFINTNALMLSGLRLKATDEIQVCRTRMRAISVIITFLTVALCAMITINWYVLRSLPSVPDRKRGSEGMYQILLLLCLYR